MLPWETPNYLGLGDAAQLCVSQGPGLPSGSCNQGTFNEGTTNKGQAGLRGTSKRWVWEGECCRSPERDCQPVAGVGWGNTYPSLSACLPSSAGDFSLAKPKPEARGQGCPLMQSIQVSAWGSERDGGVQRVDLECPGQQTIWQNDKPTEGADHQPASWRDPP